MCLSVQLVLDTSNNRSNISQVNSQPNLDSPLLPSLYILLKGFYSGIEPGESRFKVMGVWDWIILIDPP